MCTYARKCVRGTRVNESLCVHGKPPETRLCERGMPAHAQNSVLQSVVGVSQCVSQCGHNVNLRLSTL